MKLRKYIDIHLKELTKRQKLWDDIETERMFLEGKYIIYIELLQMLDRGLFDDFKGEKK